jgi:hypothetical protein
MSDGAELSPFATNVVAQLREAADVFQERAAVYKDNYAKVGNVMMALFPEGAPELQTAEQFNRWHLFELAIVKLTRFANNYEEGHEDSLVDMVVYLEMVLALYKERERLAPKPGWAEEEVHPTLFRAVPPEFPEGKTWKDTSGGAASLDVAALEGIRRRAQEESQQFFPGGKMWADSNMPRRSAVTNRYVVAEEMGG